MDDLKLSHKGSDVVGEMIEYLKSLYEELPNGKIKRMTVERGRKVFMMISKDTLEDHLHWEKVHSILYHVKKKDTSKSSTEAVHILRIRHILLEQVYKAANTVTICKIIRVLSYLNRMVS